MKRNKTPIRCLQVSGAWPPSKNVKKRLKLNKKCILNKPKGLAMKSKRTKKVVTIIWNVNVHENSLKIRFYYAKCLLVYLFIYLFPPPYQCIWPLGKADEEAICLRV